MDVYINEMTSTVRAADSEALLNPQMIERLLRLITDRVKEHQQQEKNVQDERRMRPSMTSREVSMWE
ncbi:MAG: hypothetical protein AUH11_12035 [Acidobacteria bacterium 13_2_20CM_57_17]|nr:MAG: hypothetical protein AUH11_12035 [Acidobacteria bacterium 13_2_20CM_57_17]OLB95624.1 MAG: hypothetical protein AUI02_03455 [Acidobacteria bacterium 13_2_20CM_2_57_12]OLE16060.1 MAG: hypothetical protein AUG83_04610 [Acidobacteria bacterium 13_1_20CM_4_57_11]